MPRASSRAINLGFTLPGDFALGQTKTKHISFYVSNLAVFVKMFTIKHQKSAVGSETEMDA